MSFREPAVLVGLLLIPLALLAYRRLQRRRRREAAAFANPALLPNVAHRRARLAAAPAAAARAAARSPS